MIAVCEYRDCKVKCPHYYQHEPTIIAFTGKLCTEEAVYCKAAGNSVKCIIVAER